MTATRTSTASAEAAAARRARPRIGLLGIMQELYDDMLPGITERQAAYARERRRRRWRGVADVEVAPPARDRADIERTRARASSAEGSTACSSSCSPTGPAMRVARALAETRLPICLANVQPVPEVTAAWDMADLTYNQGIHGAQDTANAMVRAGAPVPRHHRRLAAPTRSRDAVGALGARGRRGHALARAARSPSSATR